MGALTVTEAAVLMDLEPRVIRNDLEQEVIKPVERKPPRILIQQAGALRSVTLTGYKLGCEDRRRTIDKILEALAARASQVVLGQNLIMNLEPVYTLLRRAADFFEWKATLVNDPQLMNGETTFPGTRYTVQGIGHVLKRGELPEDVLEDFPGLTRRDLDYARMYVEMYKPRGRPPRKPAQVPRR
jgi:uncharacterized protein (DUF433 family)